jgi:hypothetical protein
MMRRNSISPMFVKAVPEELEDGILYVSEYGTAVHKCCCGCGSEVVTPIGPTGWKLIRQGPTVSLKPSIGNWNLPCRSHYWITQNQILWAGKWSEKQIAAARRSENKEKRAYYGKPVTAGIWSRFWNWIRGG